MVKCPNCGKEADSKFCPNCGEKLQTKFVCPHCNEELEENTNFCPECGEKAEVYSRITGYYRPIKNWNDGKSKEYKMRKVYNLNGSCEGKTKNKKVKDMIMLFGTKTCPNCKMAAKLLDKAKIEYKLIDAEENVELRQVEIRNNSEEN